MPKDVEQTKILYLLAAIFVALLIQWILTQVKKMGKNIFLYVRQ
jgi:ABC-type glucose/galactose transport system permease subunit